MPVRVFDTSADLMHRRGDGSRSSAARLPGNRSVAAFIEDLLAERIDLAIILQMAQESERVKIEVLFDEDMVAALPKQHRVGGEAGISLKSLAQETLIMSGRSRLRLRRLSAWLRQASASRSSRNRSARWAAKGVTYHAIEGPGPKAQIVIACRSTEFSKVVRDFLEVARRLARNRHHDSVHEIRGRIEDPGEHHVIRQMISK